MTERSGELSFPVLAALAATGALGSIAIHMMVPAMPAISRNLGANAESIQLAVSLYLACLGLGQLIGGASGDLIGRRITLVGAILVFLAGAIGVSMAASAHMLIGFRMLQALGGGAAIVTTRLLVADRSADADIAPRIAMMTSIVLISPAVSPYIGGLIVAHADWRYIFYLLAAIAIVSLMFSWRIREARPSGLNDLSFSRLVNGYRRVMSNLRFWRLVLAIGCASGGMYVFLSGSSFLLIDEYHLSSDEAGFCYLLVAAAGIAGTLLVKRLEKGAGAFLTGLTTTVIGAGVMVVCGLLKLENPYALVGPMLIVGLGAGMSAPAGFAAVLQAVKGAEGISSSLGGALQMLISGTAATLITRIGVHSLSGIAVAILIIVTIGRLIAPGRNPAQPS